MPAAQAAYPVAQNGRIVFERDVGGKSHVFLMNADGSNPVDLSPAGTNGDSAPQFSPDGSWIVFTRQLTPVGDLLHLIRMRPDGSRAVDLTPGLEGAGSGTFSPDGRQIAFAMDTAPGPSGFYSLAIMNADGSGIANLTPNDESFERRPDFSPDGTRIVYDRDAGGGSGLFVIGPDGSNPTQISPLVAPHDLTGAFSPRGDRIAWSRDAVPSNDYDVFIGDTGLGGAADLTPGGSSQPFKQAPSFSPDASKIAFHAYSFGPDRDIYLMDATGSPPLDLSPAATPGDSNPHWEYIYRCSKRRATIVGDDGPEKIKGTKKADVIVGNGGKDKIKGRGGNDRICGGAGKDTLIGGAGKKDKLVGGPGKDKEKQ